MKVLLPQFEQDIINESQTCKIDENEQTGFSLKNQRTRRGSLAKGLATQQRRASIDSDKTSYNEDSDFCDVTVDGGCVVLPSIHEGYQETAIYPSQETSQAEVTVNVNRQMFLPTLHAAHRFRRASIVEKPSLEVEGHDISLGATQIGGKENDFTEKNILVKDDLEISNNLNEFTEDQLIKFNAAKKTLQDLLHCNSVGIPLEIKQKQHGKDKKFCLSLLPFHCKRCLEHWKNKGEVNKSCEGPREYVEGPVVEITDGMMQILKKFLNTNMSEKQVSNEDTGQLTNAIDYHLGKAEKNNVKVKKINQFDKDSQNVDKIVKDFSNIKEEKNIKNMILKKSLENFSDDSQLQDCQTGFKKTEEHQTPTNDADTFSKKQHSTNINNTIDLKNREKESGSSVRSFHWDSAQKSNYKRTSQKYQHENFKEGKRGTKVLDCLKNNKKQLENGDEKKYIENEFERNGDEKYMQNAEENYCKIKRNELKANDGSQAAEWFDHGNDIDFSDEEYNDEFVLPGGTVVINESESIYKTLLTGLIDKYNNINNEQQISCPDDSAVKTSHLNLTKDLHSKDSADELNGEYNKTKQVDNYGTHYVRRGSQAGHQTQPKISFEKTSTHSKFAKRRATNLVTEVDKSSVAHDKKNKDRKADKETKTSTGAATEKGKLSLSDSYYDQINKSSCSSTKKVSMANIEAMAKSENVSNYQRGAKRAVIRNKAVKNRTGVPGTRAGALAKNTYGVKSSNEETFTKNGSENEANSKMHTVNSGEAEQNHANEYLEKNSSKKQHAKNSTNGSLQQKSFHHDGVVRKTGETYPTRNKMRNSAKPYNSRLLEDSSTMSSANSGNTAQEVLFKRKQIVSDSVSLLDSQRDTSNSTESSSPAAIPAMRMHKKSSASVSTAKFHPLNTNESTGLKTRRKSQQIKESSSKIYKQSNKNISVLPPLPPINLGDKKKSQEMASVTRDEVSSRPIAKVKPTVNKTSSSELCADKDASYSQTEVAAEQPSISARSNSTFSLPPADAISILSFSAAFSFSVFGDVPRQYADRNRQLAEDADRCPRILTNCSQQKGSAGKQTAKRTADALRQAKTAMQEQVGKRDASLLTRGGGGGHSEGSEDFAALTRRMQRRVDNPKPITRYVKKMRPINESSGSVNPKERRTSERQMHTPPVELDVVEDPVTLSDGQAQEACEFEVLSETTSDMSSDIKITLSLSIKESNKRVKSSDPTENDIPDDVINQKGIHVQTKEKRGYTGMLPEGAESVIIHVHNINET